MDREIRSENELNLTEGWNGSRNNNDDAALQGMNEILNRFVVSSSFRARFEKG